VTQVFAADGDKVGGEDTHALFIYDYSFREDYILPEIELTEHLQSSSALTANLASNSDDFDLIVSDQVHYTDHTLFLFTPPIANFNNYEGGENNLVRFSDGGAGAMSCSAAAATTYSRALRLMISPRTFSTAAMASIRSILTTMSCSCSRRRCCSATTAP
jgi:hypothetical protein